MRLKAVILFVALVGFVFLCTVSLKKDVVPNTGKIMQVKPIKGNDILKLKLQPMPDKSKPVLAIPIKVPVKKPGVVSSPVVVVSEAGNTFVAIADKIERGFMLEPFMLAGYTDSIFFGVGTSIFTYWRFDTTVHLCYGIDSNLFLGLGETFKLTNNTAIGITVLKDKNFDTHFGVCATIKF